MAVFVIFVFSHVFLLFVGWFVVCLVSVGLWSLDSLCCVVLLVVLFFMSVRMVILSFSYLFIESVFCFCFCFLGVFFMNIVSVGR